MSETGCWAAEYGNQLNLSYEEMDNIVKQGTELGTYVYLFTGGEPMVRKKDIIHLCEDHPDCIFSAFTNGTLIDGAFADEMLRVKNFIPAISIEGFEEASVWYFMLLYQCKCRGGSAVKNILTGWWIWAQNLHGFLPTCRSEKVR